MDEQLELNKRIVREYNDLIINQRKPEEAISKYLGPNYRQHNPGSGDSPEALIGTLKWFEQTYPEYTIETKRMIAEGDLVVLHSHFIREPGDRGMAIVEIFRLENGKSVEHWDVAQDVPETSANNNTMF